LSDVAVIIPVTFTYKGRTGTASFIDFSDPERASEWARSVQGQIRKVMNEPTNRNRPVIIVAHSWGTVMSTLSLYGGEVKGEHINGINEGVGADKKIHVAQFFTLGSPLGRMHASIAGSLRQIAGLDIDLSEDNVGEEKLIGAWTNIFDPKDPVAATAPELSGSIKKIKNIAVDCDRYFGVSRHLDIWHHPFVIYLVRRVFWDQVRKWWQNTLPKKSAALPTPGQGPKMGSKIFNLVPGPKGFAISGELEFGDLNKSGVPESEELLVEAEIGVKPGHRWRVLPDLIRVPGGAAKDGRLLTAAEKSGTGIALLSLKSSLLRKAPVWKEYGGLQLWPKQAPDSVRQSWQGTIPSEHAGKPCRVIASLKCSRGGPYAQWESVFFVYKTMYEGTLPKIAAGTKSPPDELTLVDLFSEAHLIFAEGVSLIFDRPGYASLPDGTLVLAPEGGVRMTVEENSLSSDQRSFKLKIERNEGMATVLLPQGGREDLWDSFDVMDASQINTVAGEVRIGPDVTPVFGGTATLEVAYRRSGEVWQRESWLSAGSGQVVQYGLSGRSGYWGSRGVNLFAQNEEARAKITGWSPRMTLNGRNVTRSKQLIGSGFGWADVRNSDGYMASISPLSGYVTSGNGSSTVYNVAGESKELNTGQTASVCVGEPIRVVAASELKGKRLVECGNYSSDPGVSYELWVPVKRGKNAVEVSARGICVEAMESGAGFAVRKRPYEFSRDYSVTFDFLANHLKSQWFYIFSDAFAILVLEEGGSVKYYDLASAQAFVEANFKLIDGIWYSFRIDGSPQRNTYKVSIDGREVVQAKLVKTGVYQGTPADQVVIGDNFDRAAFGSGCWRNIRFSQESGPLPPAGGEPGGVKTGKPMDERQAYADYIAAYNRYTVLLGQGKGDTPEGKAAREAFERAKKVYEEAVKKR
jgi:hypothetical protein